MDIMDAIMKELEVGGAGVGATGGGGAVCGCNRWGWGSVWVQQVGVGQCVALHGIR